MAVLDDGARLIGSDIDPARLRALGRCQAEIDQADRLFRRAAGGAGDAGGRKAEVGTESRCARLRPSRRRLRG